MGRQGWWAERLSGRRSLGSREERTKEGKRRETPRASQADVEQDTQNGRKGKSPKEKCR